MSIPLLEVILDPLGYDILWGPIQACTIYTTHPGALTRLRMNSQRALTKSKGNRSEADVRSALTTYGKRW